MDVYISHKAITHYCLLRKGVSPCIMRFISPRWDGNKVFHQVAKDTHDWREFSILVRSISVLQHCTFESVSINISIMRGIINDKAFNSLDTNFCTAIAVRKSCRGQSMMDALILQKLPCACRSKFWAAIRRQIVWDTKGNEDIEVDKKTYVIKQ